MRPTHLKPLNYHNLPNQVNQELDISEMEIITDLVKLSVFVKGRAKNDRAKADITKEAIEKKPEIISYFKDSKSLSGFITDLNIANNSGKTALVKKIIEKNPGIISDLTDSKSLSGFIGDLNIATDQYRTDLTIAIIEKNPGIISNLKGSEALLGFIKDLDIDYNTYKTDLTIAIIKNNPEILGDEKEKNLSEIIENFKLHYLPNLLFKILKELPQDLNISFGKFNSNLYKNNHLKKDLVLLAMDKKVINKDNFFNCGFDDLKKEGLHLQIIEKAKEKGIVTNKDLFNYLEDKLPNCYDSLKSALNDKKVEDIIREEAIPNIANSIYGDNPAPKDIKELGDKKATSLISYFDFFNKNEFIASSLKEDSKQELKSSFRPINPKQIISRDVKNIASLLGMNKEDFKGEYYGSKKNLKAGNGVPNEIDLGQENAEIGAPSLASPSQLVADSRAQDSSSQNYPVVTVSNTPSNSPSPFTGCFQAFLKCFGVRR